MGKRTIKDAIIQVLTIENKTLSPKEIYEKIVEQKLYEFKSKNPVSIVNAELRKSCHGLNLKKSYPNKTFQLHENGKYSIK